MHQDLYFSLLTSFVLGLRHGIDWDHIAAITDIVGAVESQSEVESQGTVESQTLESKHRALFLATMYAVGHGSLVFILGLGALLFAAQLPSWIDPIMERIVGGTLIVLGLWIFYSLINYLVTGRQVPVRSRWMITFAAIRKLVQKITGKVNELEVKPPGVKTSFAIGTLHAIGAETGTQVLLLTAVSTIAIANNHALGILLLFSFVLGLILSNTLVAIFSKLGFVYSKFARPLYTTTALCTAIFSLTIGTYFVTGNPDNLPDLQRVFETNRKI